MSYYNNYCQELQQAYGSNTCDQILIVKMGMTCYPIMSYVGKSINGLVALETKTEWQARQCLQTLAGRDNIDFLPLTGRTQQLEIRNDGMEYEILPYCYSGIDSAKEKLNYLLEQLQTDSHNGEQILLVWFPEGVPESCMDICAGRIRFESGNLETDLAKYESGFKRELIEFFREQQNKLVEIIRDVNEKTLPENDTTVFLDVSVAALKLYLGESRALADGLDKETDLRINHAYEQLISTWNLVCEIEWEEEFSSLMYRAVSFLPGILERKRLKADDERVNSCPLFDSRYYYLGQNQLEKILEPTGVAFCDAKESLGEAGIIVRNKRGGKYYYTCKASLSIGDQYLHRRYIKIRREFVDREEGLTWQEMLQARGI